MRSIPEGYSHSLPQRTGPETWFCGPESRKSLFRKKTIKFGEVLGEGASGTVFAAEVVGLATQFAVKAEAVDGTARNNSSLRREFELYVKFGPAPMLVEFYVRFSLSIGVRNFECILMERGRSAADLPPDELLARRWEILRDVTRALQVMHARKVFHGDLKMDNVLLCGDKFKLTDFGLSSMFGTYYASGTFASPITTYNMYHFIISKLSDSLVPLRRKLEAAALASKWWDGTDGAEEGGEDIYALGALWCSLTRTEQPIGRRAVQKAGEDNTTYVLRVIDHIKASSEKVRQLRQQAEQDPAAFGWSRPDCEFFLACMCMLPEDRLPLNDIEGIIAGAL